MHAIYSVDGMCGPRFDYWLLLLLLLLGQEHFAYIALVYPAALIGHGEANINSPYPI